MHAIQITTALLEELVKLMDWQIRDRGFDPDTITAAWLAYTDSH